MAGVKLIGDQKTCSKALNDLCREQMKFKIMADLRMDLLVCELEDYDKLEYLYELKELIDSFVNKIKK